MLFEADQQTYIDLDLFPQGKGSSSIFSLFDHTITSGGNSRLEYFFKNPFSEYELLNDRKNSILFFQHNNIIFVPDKVKTDFVEHYLLQGDYPTVFSGFRAYEKAIFNFFKESNAHYIISRGIRYLIDLLNDLYLFFVETGKLECPSLISKYRQTIESSFRLPEFSIIKSLQKRKRLYPHEIERLDLIFRYTMKEKIRELLTIYYELDVFISVASVAEKRGFSLPEYVKQSELFIELTGLTHPFPENPVGNDLFFNPDSNMLFLSGPNMAGKSTLLKSIGVAVFLAHIGFPVPALKMKTSIFDGLLTGINIPDSITRGQSHFYSEVKRVKVVAEGISRNMKLVVLFDELFRSTNIRDSYDGSLSIIKALAKVNHSVFLFSSHITELAEPLHENENIQFKSISCSNDPHNSKNNYRLADGVNNERNGMSIIESEGILDLIGQTIKNKEENQTFKKS